MSIAFSLDAGPSAAVRRTIVAAHLTAVAGIAATTAALAFDARALAAALFAIASLPLVVISARRALSTIACGRLQVSAQGAPSWQPPGDPAVAIEAIRWFRLGALTWIDARSGAGRLRLLLGRDRIADAEWRSLQVWLRWMDRGGLADTGAPRN